MNDIDYGAVFGLDEGAKEPAPAQQDTGDTETPAQTEDAQDAAGAETDTDAGAKETEPAAQSAEENAKYAAARRKAEADAAKYVEETIKSLGLTDFNGKPITTKAELDKYRAAQAKERKSMIAENAGMTESELDQFIQELPEVKEARQAAETARMQQMKMMLDEQVKAISAVDPSVQSVEDLLKRPEYPAIYARVQKGETILSAYKAENFDALLKAAADRAVQAARNSASSKDHLSPTATRGAGAVPVPADVRAYYKALNPEMTDAEISAHYQKHHKA